MFPVLASVCVLKSQNFTLLFKGRDEIWALVGYYAAYSDNFLTLEYGTDRLSRSVGKESSLYATQYCRRAQVSSTVRRKPEITPEKWCPQRHSRFCKPAASELMVDSQLVTNSVKHSHFWEVDNSSAAQEVPRISMNPKVHYHVHNNMNQIIPVHALQSTFFNPLNAELNPICYLLALLGAYHFLHVSRIRVKSLTLRLLKSYIHGAPILDVSRSQTTTHHSR